MHFQPLKLTMESTTGVTPTVVSILLPSLVQLRYKEPGQKIYWPSSEVSPRSAEMRADLGNAADFWQMQVFDGPAPETINGRLSMLGRWCP